MITLKIDNSESQILGLESEMLKELRDKLTYTTSPQASYFSGNYRSQKRHLMDKNGRFPTGLLYIVKSFLRPVKHEVIDLRIRPNSVESNQTKLIDVFTALHEERKRLFSASFSFEPYPEQEEAAELAIRAARGIIVAPTGLGKSVIIALIINKLQVKTLVVVPSLELKRQLSKSLGDVFGHAVIENKNIWVENVDALATDKQLEGYDAVIIDEFHHSGAKTYRKLNKKAWNKIYYRIGFTATPFRSQDNERLLLESVLSNTIYKIWYSDCVERKRIVPMEAYYIDLPKTTCTGRTWSQVYSQLVVNNEFRNRTITSLLSALNQFGRPTLCLVKEILHGALLSNGGAFPFVSGQTVKRCQADDGEEDLISRFSRGEIKTLIGTTGVIGEGVDTKACEYVIIAGLGKSKNAFMQQVGRGFRNFPGKENCTIILFRDPSHKWTLAHFNAQVKYLREEYGIEPQKLTKD